MSRLNKKDRWERVYKTVPQYVHDHYEKEVKENPTGDQIEIWNKWYGKYRLEFRLEKYTPGQPWIDHKAAKMLKDFLDQREKEALPHQHHMMSFFIKK